MSEPFNLTAEALARAIREGHISAVEATESALRRMEAVNPAINAVVDPLPEEALATARAADAAQRAGRSLGPLHGVPVTVKINVDYGGRATTNGVVALRDNIAPEDGSVVRNLKAAGAIIIGRTNTPCFSMRICTVNDLHGHTRNPHDPGLTPGGSSGGAGAATATGIGAIGHGNDIGGSIRYPAYCNGLYGLRPSVGLAACYNPTETNGRFIVTELANVDGPQARSVEDLRLAMLALSAPDPRDAIQTPAAGLFAPLGHTPCRVAMLAETEESEVAPEVSAAIRQAGAILADAGYDVVETPPPSMLDLLGYWRLMLGNEMRAGLGPRIVAQGDAGMRRAWEILAHDLPDLSGRDDFLRALAQRATLLRQWQALFTDCPLLLTATSWARPMPDGYDIAEDADGEWIARASAPAAGPPIIGLPGLAVPVGTCPGAPMGVQLLSHRYGDRRLLEAGAVIERAIGPVLPVNPAAAL